jgi:hypothetical protein
MLNGLILNLLKYGIEFLEIHHHMKITTHQIVTLNVLSSVTQTTHEIVHLNHVNITEVVDDDEEDDEVEVVEDEVVQKIVISVYLQTEKVLQLTNI